MKEFKYVITDELGIHARPAGLLVKEAARIFGIMGLAAKKGDEIVLTADGTDEADAIAAIEEFLKANL